eukprot:6205393-Amphidinium_carterae.1
MSPQFPSSWKFLIPLTVPPCSLLSHLSIAWHLRAQLSQLVTQLSNSVTVTQKQTPPWRC